MKAPAKPATSSVIDLCGLNNPCVVHSQCQVPQRKDSARLNRCKELVNCRQRFAPGRRLPKRASSWGILVVTRGELEMAVIHAVNFENWYRQFKRVELLHPQRSKTGRYEITFITGQNGSHKSTLLKQLVAALVSPVRQGVLGETVESEFNPHRHQVLCVSGSLADRFPQKELPGGKRSSFDVPYYTYIGQRVLNNLLSRKAPLEAMLNFALAPRAVERCRWKFFSDAHAHAGILPSVTYTLTPRNGGARDDSRYRLSDLRGQLSTITPETDLLRFSERSFPDVSFATAQWLLQEFSSEDFFSLQTMLEGKRKRRFRVVLDDKGAHGEEVAPNVLRLGLLLEVLRLGEVEVNAARLGAKFSLFELSSGEYHMFSTILAIGFGLDEQSVLLIDEPENNLHPQWQRDLIGTVFGVCSQVMTNGHVIICTHSPLIVGAALEGSTVVDMTGDEPQMSVVSYGASADELLLAQFGVGSSRNQVVVDTVQRAVSLVERGDFENPEFEALIPELRSIRNALTPTDPMVDVINALLDEEPVR